MSYELELPKEIKIHNVFHVSSLKKTLGQHIAPSIELPPLYEEGLLVPIPRESYMCEKGSSETGWVESTW